MEEVEAPPPARARLRGGGECVNTGGHRVALPGRARVGQRRFARSGAGTSRECDDERTLRPYDQIRPTINVPAPPPHADRSFTRVAEPGAAEAPVALRPLSRLGLRQWCKGPLLTDADMPAGCLAFFWQHACRPSPPETGSVQAGMRPSCLLREMDPTELVAVGVPKIGELDRAHGCGVARTGWCFDRGAAIGDRRVMKLLHLLG